MVNQGRHTIEIIRLEPTLPGDEVLYSLFVDGVSRMQDRDYDLVCRVEQQYQKNLLDADMEGETNGSHH